MKNGLKKQTDRDQGMGLLKEKGLARRLEYWLTAFRICGAEAMSKTK